MNRRVFALVAFGAIVEVAAARASVDFERVEVLRAGEDVLALAQSADNFLWIGTAGGLYRFDGRELKALDEGLELRRPVVALLATATATRPTLPATQTPGGALWAALDNPATVVRFSGGVRTSWTAREGLALKHIRALAASDDARVFVAGEGGVFEIAGPLVKQVAWPAGGEGDVRVLAAARGGGLWVGTTVGIGLLRRGRFTMAWRGGNVRALIETRPDRLLVTAELPDRTQGFLSLDLSRSAPRVERLRPDLRVHAFTPDGAGGAWIGTRPGLVRIDAAGAIGPRGQLPSHEVNSLLRDHEGNLWLATTLGLVRVPRSRPFRIVATEPSEVTSVRALSDGSVLLLLDPDSVMHVPPPDHIGPPRTLGGRIAPHGMLGIIEDDRGAAWMGSWEEGLFRFDGRELSAVPLRGWIAGDTVRPLSWSPRHGMVLAVGSERVALGAPAAPAWIDLEPLGVRSEIVAGVEEPSGRLWLASERQGLVVLDAPRSARRVGRQDGLPSENLTALAAAPGGGLWIGTRDVGLVHHRAGRFTTIGRKQGLTTDAIGGITPDGRGQLWITTAGAGMIRVDQSMLLAVVAGTRAQTTSTVFTARDGLLTTGAPGRSPAAGSVDRAGRLWLASFRGAVVFDSPAAPSSPPLPVPRIESVRLDGHEIALAGPHQARVSLGQGELQVRYTAVLFEGRERLRFRYRLAGFESAWRDVGDAHEASYSRLPAGSYRFQVVPYFVGVSDAAAPAETTFAFALVPPFYETRAFFVSLSLLLAGAVALALALRLRFVRRRLALLSHERSRIAREIHDSLEQTLYAAKLQLEVAGGQAPAPRPNLARGLELVERAIDETRAAVWALRTGVFGRADLATAISVTAGDALRHSDVGFSLETEGVPYRLSAVTEWHVGQTVREAFTNALKHASPKHMTVRLSYAAEGVRVSVVDDGVGLDEDPDTGVHSGHYGLQGMRERLRACGGAVTLDSEPGRGTTVFIQVPRSPANRA